MAFLAGEFDSADTLATPTLHVELVELRALSVASLGHDQDCCVVTRHVDRDHPVIRRLELHAPHAGRRPSHRPHVALVEADRHAAMGNHEDVVGSTGLDDTHKFVVIVEVDGDQSIAATRVIGIERCLLDRSLLRREEQEPLAREVTGVDNRLDVFIGLQWQQVDDRHALRGALALGYLHRS